MLQHAASVELFVRGGREHLSTGKHVWIALWVEGFRVHRFGLQGLIRVCGFKV